MAKIPKLFNSPLSIFNFQLSIFFILIFNFQLSIFNSCTSAESYRDKQINQIDKEILDIHDEVMPKIGKVLSLRKRINQKLESCNNQIEKDSLQEISYQLTKADADMMHWMRRYKKPEGLDTAMQYLKVQQQEIKKVKEQINQSIQRAEINLKK